MLDLLVNADAKWLVGGGDPVPSFEYIQQLQPRWLEGWASQPSLFVYLEIM